MTSKSRFSIDRRATMAIGSSQLPRRSSGSIGAPPRLGESTAASLSRPTVTRAHLLEIIDDRAAQRATVITRKLPIEHWHA